MSGLLSGFAELDDQARSLFRPGPLHFATDLDGAEYVLDHKSFAVAQ